MTEQPKQVYESKLTVGRERFLAHVVDHAITVGRRSADDFVRNFPPEEIMQKLGDRPELRAEILAQTTGLKVRIAVKKTWQSAAEDLRIALTEAETDAATIVAAFHPDDRVRFLDHGRLWSFVIEGEFWKRTEGTAGKDKSSSQHLAFMLDRALTDSLITHRDIIDGISVGEIAARLPKAELGKIIEGALAAGHRRSPFTESDLWAALTAVVLVEYVPLRLVWERVIQPKVAEAHGYVTSSPESTPAPGSLSPDPEWVEVANSAVSAPSTEVVSDDDFE